MPTDDELLGRLGRSLAPEPRDPPADRIAALRALVEDRPLLPGRPSPVRRKALGRRLAYGAVAVAVAGGLFVAGTQVAPRPAPTQAAGVLEFRASLRAPDGASTASVEGRRVGVGRIVHLNTNQLPILPKGEYYEIWLVGPGDAPGRPNRISAGTFHPDPQGRSDVEVTAAFDPTKFPELSVTAEPGDGDPAPSGREVLRGRLELRG